VRETAVNWLRAKGFVESTDVPLFPFDENNDRGLVLAFDGQWTTVAYSHWDSEGERLAFELKKIFPVILEIWVYDSDIWGYRLQEAGKLVASFNSNPRYFGSPPELELPVNGDPRLLCEAIGRPELAQEIKRLQSLRAVFKEQIANRFCQTLGVDLAGVDYHDLSDSGVEAGPPVCLGGFNVEMLHFRRASADAARPLHLHDIRIVVPPVPKVDPQAAEWQSMMQKQMFPMIFLIRYVLGPLLRFLFWILTPLVHLFLFFFFRINRGVALPPWFADLQAIEKKVVEQEGNRLVNRRHRCRITLPSDASWGAAHNRLPDVFAFLLAETLVRCDAIRPSGLAQLFRVWPESEVVEDEKFSVREFPARMVQIQYRHGEKTMRVAWWLIQTPKVVYRFQITEEGELSQSLCLHLRSILESFELI
jgi:hypothetical protein